MWFRLPLLILLASSLSFALPRRSSKSKRVALEIVIGLGETADGLTSEVEAMDIHDPHKSCILPNFPNSVVGAIGYYNFAFFCGGHNSTGYSNECYYLDETKTWIRGPDLPQKRAYGASEGEMIFGGFDGSEGIASIVGLIEGEDWSQALPDLPVKLHGHCVVYLLFFDFMVIGGIQDGKPSNKTYIFSVFDQRWTEGPELNVPRSGASCALLDGIVVTGGYNEEGYLSSTEFTPGVDDPWQFGPDLPEPLCCAGQVKEDDLYVIGGSSPSGEPLDTIYTMSSIESGWSKLDTKLKTPRKFPAVAVDTFGYCDLK